MRVVLDTNVLVSALLSPFGAPARILDLVLAGDLQLAFDDRIVAEYREVLARPKFGFAPADVQDLLEYVKGAGEPVTARPLRITLPDPEDLPFVEVAVEVGAPLITGNTAHYQPAASLGVTVVAPRAFIESWRGAS